MKTNWTLLTGFIVYVFSEQVPSDMDKLLSDTPSVKADFYRTVSRSQQQFMADHMVFDLLDFFVNLNSLNQSQSVTALSSITEILQNATKTVTSLHDREVCSVYICCVQRNIVNPDILVPLNVF